MKKDDTTHLSRRHFFRQSTCASLGITGVVNSLAHLRLMNAALASSAPVGDYKALVVVFLFGGNDSNNMLVPFGSNPARPDYESARGTLALSQNDLAPLNFPSAGNRQFGLHPSMAQVAPLFNNGDMAFVANVGSLAFPTTRAQYLGGAVPLPPQLFSHSDQQVQWQSSIADKPFQSGWGGRVADLLNASYNQNSQVSMSVSLSGINRYQVGTSGAVSQYAVTPNGAISLDGFGNNYSAALNPNGTYKTNNTGRRLRAFEQVMNYTHEHLMEEQHSTIVRNARNNEAFVNDALIAAADSGVNFDSIFADANTSLGDQLKMISKLIAGRDCLGNRRQIFFCSANGYDTHQEQLGAHADLLEELGGALKSFNDTMGALGTKNDVVTMTHSDFARTLTPNGNNNSAGSDHGWGGHQIVMGGPVKGTKVYGKFPSLRVGEDDDTDRNRGRWIPTTSVDQYSSVVARWLGVNTNELDAIFPNLPRFDDPATVASANLDFINFSA